MKNKWVLKFRNFMHDFLMSVAPLRLKKKIMSCEEITKIMASDTEMPVSKKFWFKMHNFLCSCCSNYQDQFKIIKIQSHKLMTRELSNEEKERIKNSKKDIISKISHL